MLRRKPLRSERRSGKVLEVGGEDDVCLALYRRGDDVAVVRVRQLNRRYEFLEAGN